MVLLALACRTGPLLYLYAESERLSRIQTPNGGSTSGGFSRLPSYGLVGKCIVQLLDQLVAFDRQPADIADVHSLFELLVIPLQLLLDGTVIFHFLGREFDFHAYDE